MTTVPVTAIILLVFGGILLLRGLPGVAELIASRGWRSVPGQITGSGVQSYMTHAGGGEGRAPVQSAVVGYVYEVDGHRFAGNRATFGSPLGYGMGLGGIAASHAAAYQAGDQVTVWADPHDPRNSVLRRAAPSSVVITAAGAGAAVLGLLSL